jgi:hypothetical protein
MCYNQFSRSCPKRLPKTTFTKMIVHVFYCILILLLCCTTFVQLCPPSAKPTSPQTSSISATDPPATIPTDVINRKDLLLVPIKGKILTLLWKKHVTHKVYSLWFQRMLVQMYADKSKIIMRQLSWNMYRKLHGSWSINEKSHKCLAKYF